MPSVCFPICIVGVRYSVTLRTGEVGVKWEFHGGEIKVRIKNNSDRNQKG